MVIIIHSPAVIRLLRDLDRPADVPDGLPLAQFNICLSQLRDNLLRCLSLPRLNLFYPIE
jgi:hypothetical protein